MASHFSANQYNDAFKAGRLQQYTKPHQYKEHPRQRDGETLIRANDRGHLLEGVPRSKDSPWGNHYVGTWDLPRTLPSNYADNGCARTEKAHAQLLKEKYDTEQRIAEAARLPAKQRTRPPKTMPVRNMVACGCSELPGQPKRRILSPQSPEPKMEAYIDDNSDADILPLPPMEAVVAVEEERDRIIED